MKKKASLRESRQCYEAFNDALASFENIDPAIVGLTFTGKIVYVNHSACDLLGYSKEELEGLPIGAITPEMTAADWSSFWSALDQEDVKPGRTILHPPTKEELSVEFKALFNHGSWLKYCVMIKPGKSPTPASNGETHTRPLVLVLNSMTNHVVVLDDQHKVIYLNQAVSQSLGTTVAEAAGTTVYDYFPKRQAEIAWEHEQNALDSMRPSTRVGDGFLRAKFAESVTMLPFLDPGTSQKRLLVIVNSSPQTAHPPPMVVRGSHEPVPGLLRLDYLAELQELIYNTVPVGIFLKNTDNRYLLVNHAFAKMNGCEPKDLNGMRVEDLVAEPEIMATLRKEDDYVYATRQPLFNQIIPRINNQPGYYRIDKIPFANRNGELVGIIGLVVEVDEPQPPVEALKEELSSTSRKLQETETALRVLIERREQDVSLTRETLNTKVKDLLVPYLEHLKQTQLKPEQAEFVDLIETNLKNFYDPAYARLSSPTYKLSPTELKVAQLVRDGKTNKEIAKLLHLSKSTILTHRHHVRAKLGIKNKKVNLRSLLCS